MSKALKELTNIGVPIYTPLRLWIQDMTLTCSDHKGKTISLEREVREEVKNRVDKVVGKESQNIKRDFLTDISFYANNNSTSEFNVSNRERIVDIFQNLIDYTKLEGQNEEEVLMNLRKWKKIYSYYVEYIQSNPFTTEIHNDLKRDYNRLYYGREKGKDLRSYLIHELSYYDKVEYKLDEIQKIDFTDLLTDYTDDLNPEKVAMYLAGYYMDEAFLGVKENDRIKAQESLLYISAFLRSGIDKRLILPMNGRGETSYNSIKDQFDFIRDTFDLDLYDIYYKRKNFEGKDLEENKKAVNSLISMKRLKTDESFIKPGEKKETKNKTGRKRIITETTEEERRQIKEYLDYKELQYLKHGPIAQIDCDHEFSNYKAFLYENGIMPADRLKNVNTITEMKADSIYFFDAETFDDDITKTKTELRESSKIKPLNHSGTWEERLDKIIEMDTSDKLKEAAKQMVKKKNI